MEAFKKIFGVFIVLIGIGDSWFGGAVIVACGLSLLVKKGGNIMFREWGEQ